MAFAEVFTTWALIPILCYICYTLYTQKCKPPNALDLLPWVGLPTGPFSRLRAKLDPASGKEWLSDAFEMYTRKDKKFVFQAFMGKPVVVMPRSLVKWMLEQPDNLLGFKESVEDNLSLEITSLEPLIAANPLHHDVIKGPLTRALELTPKLIMDELRESFGTQWGQSSDWTEHVAWESMTKVFAQITGRVFIGKPLCRNEDFLENIVCFAEDVITTGTIIRPIPKLLRSVLGWVLTRRNRRHYSKVFSYVGPVIEQRKQDMARKSKDPGYKFEEVSDMLQWIIDRAYETEDPREYDNHTICKRFAITCFAAIHTTAVTSTNALFDILAADFQSGIIAVLREEINQVQKQDGPEWSKASLSKLEQLDSAIRESMRMHSVACWGIQRAVHAKQGLTMPDGMHVPCGVDLAVPAYFIQRDSDLYEDPEKYDPFRFSRSRGATAASQASSADIQIETSGEQDRMRSILQSRNLAAVSTGHDQFSFGGGRHACPGRFFAIQEVKLVLIYQILNYDMKPLASRPSNPWIRDLLTPNTTASVSVRKI